MSSEASKQAPLPPMSGLLPSFVRALQDPEIKTVLCCGCGGGFDFMHSMILYPELMRLGKEVVIASFSFGQPQEISNAEVVNYPEYKEGENGKGTNLCVKVTGKSEGPSHYAPEVHLVRYLDTQYPKQAPHFCYAMYARAFSPVTLRSLYGKLVTDHNIDAIVLMDGGTDSLVRGDEVGLGDPVEDAISVATIATLEDERIRLRLLCTAGFGCDRFNNVSDASSLRAVAELTRLGGFRGTIAIEQTMPGFQFYRDLIHSTNKCQSFHSVLSSSLIASVEGWFGSEEIPPEIKPRITSGKLYIWPLMGMIFAFDVNTVFHRSQICQAIRDAKTYQECDENFIKLRREIKDSIRGIEQLPRFEDYSSSVFFQKHMSGK